MRPTLASPAKRRKLRLCDDGDDSSASEMLLDTPLTSCHAEAAQAMDDIAINAPLPAPVPA